MNEIDELLLQSTILLHRQALLTENLIKSGGQICIEFQHAVAENRQSVENVLNVLNYAFGLIDNLVRFQKIAGSIPRLNQKSPEYRLFSNGMGKLKDARNNHQHINNELINSFSGPLLGSVSWTDGSKCYTACLHDIGRERSMPGLIYDTIERKFTSEFCYIFGEKYHDLQKAIVSMRDYINYIERIVQIRLNKSPIIISDHYLVISVEFDLSKNDDLD